MMNEDETLIIESTNNDRTDTFHEQVALVDTNLITKSQQISQKPTIMMSEHEQFILVDSLSKLTQYDFDGSNESSHENLNRALITRLETPLNIEIGPDKSRNGTDEEKFLSPIHNIILEEFHTTTQKPTMTKFNDSTNIFNPSIKSNSTSLNIVELVVEEMLHEIVNNVQQSLSPIKQNSQIEIDTLNINSNNNQQDKIKQLSQNLSPGKLLNEEIDLQQISKSIILLEKINETSKIDKNQPENLAMKFNQTQKESEAQTHLEKEKAITYSCDITPDIEIYNPLRKTAFVSSPLPLNESTSPMIQFENANKNNLIISNVHDILMNNQLVNFRNEKPIVKQATLQKTVTFTKIYIFEEYFDPVKKKILRKHLEKNKTKTVHTDHKFYQILENYQPNSIFPKSSTNEKKGNDDSFSESSLNDSFYSAESPKSFDNNINSTNEVNAHTTNATTHFDRANKKTFDYLKESHKPSKNKDKINLITDDVEDKPSHAKSSNRNSSNYANDIDPVNLNVRSFAKKRTSRRNYLSNRYDKHDESDNSGASDSFPSTRSKKLNGICSKKRINSTNNKNKNRSNRRRAISFSSNSSNKIAVTKPFDFSSIKIKLTTDKSKSETNNQSITINNEPTNQQPINELDQPQDQNESVIINNDFMLSNTTTDNKDSATKSWIIQQNLQMLPLTQPSISINNQSGLDEFLTTFNENNLMNDSVFMNESYPTNYIQNEVEIIGYEEDVDNDTDNLGGLDSNTNTNNYDHLLKKFKIKSCRVDLEDLTLKDPELLIKKRINLSSDYRVPKAEDEDDKIRITRKSFSKKTNKRLSKPPKNSEVTPKPIKKSIKNSQSEILAPAKRINSSDVELISINESKSNSPDLDTSSPSFNTRNRMKKISLGQLPIPSPLNKRKKVKTVSSTSSTLAQSRSHQNISIKHKFKLNESVFARDIDGHYYPATVNKIVNAVEPKTNLKIEYYNVVYHRINKNGSNYLKSAKSENMFTSEQLIPIDILDKHDPVLIFDRQFGEYTNASFLSYSFENNNKMDGTESFYVVSCKKTGLTRTCKLEQMAIHKRNVDLMFKRFRENLLEDMKLQEHRNNFDYYQDNFDQVKESEDDYEVRASNQATKRKLSDQDLFKDSQISRSIMHSKKYDYSSINEEEDTSRRSSIILTTSREVNTSRRNNSVLSSSYFTKRNSLIFESKN